MKKTLFWNDLHNQLRMPQGVPAEIPVLPQQGSTAEEILELNTNTVFHVASQLGSKEAVYLFASSPNECTIYVRIIPSSLLAPNATKTRVTNWPSTLDAMTFTIRPNQPSPIPIIQGHQISNGAAVTLLASSPGARGFGFAVV
mgnify:CR=1